MFFVLQTNNSIYLSNSHGFTADLIHRDSPLSPWYNSSVSHYDRLHNAFRRSVTRANHFAKPIITSLSSSSSANIQSRIIASAGEYLMNVSIGTPPVEVLGIADTGSDLIWTQCKPCKQCFNQNPPLFDPKKSGTLAVETFTIGSTSGRPVSLPKILFGCGHQNGGTFDESEKRLAYKTKSSPNFEDDVAVAANEGNIIIDSGTTLTLLPPGFYEDLESALEVAINAERVSDPKGILSLCFRSESDDIGVPVITAHFKGADVKLQAVNTFARIEDDLVCLTMIPSSDVAIFGNLAQINFLVGYDLEERTVSFKPADCTDH
ncbi:unnamed protein product [Malus baccata var. baccata]